MWFTLWDGTSMNLAIKEVKEQKAAVTFQKILVYGGLGLIIFVVLAFIFRRRK